MIYIYYVLLLLVATELDLDNCKQTECIFCNWDDCNYRRGESETKYNIGIGHWRPRHHVYATGYASSQGHTDKIAHVQWAGVPGG